jgi:hypothetical protein
MNQLNGLKAKLSSLIINPKSAKPLKIIPYLNFHPCKMYNYPSGHRIFTQMDKEISQKTLSSYRSTTYRLLPHLKLHNFEQAVDFVNERGFVFFWPNKAVSFPSLWTAVAGDRPVPDQHDDPGHITWNWKDKALGKKVWYYGRVLTNRNAMISLEDLPSFYALSPNYGSPAEDYLEQYAAGQLTAEAKSVYEALLDHGPMDTLDLRRAAHMTNPESDSRFNKAISTLQMEFKVMPVGISQAGAWKYAFIYDLTHRHFPALIEEARQVHEYQASRSLALHCLKSVGVATTSQVSRMFHWPTERTATTLSQLVDLGLLTYPVKLENTGGDHFAIPVLVYN